MTLLFFALFAFLAGTSTADSTTQAPASGAPTNYTGIPQGDYSPEWQQYFHVPQSLPGINFSLSNSYAGNIYVDRPGHPNNTLFFWGFEKQNGSLTAPAGNLSTEPWAIWLQGGPGFSSLYGMFTENGPIQPQPGSKTLTQNPYAWNNLVDYIWVDQPVGVGFATADTNGYAVDQDQVGTDFVAFLRNLVKVFPSLATRPFYLTGESYAGRYIPYIAKALFSDPNPPVQLAKLVVGDPGFGSVNEFKTMPTLSLLETYPQIIGYDTGVFDYFKQQSHLCHLDINVTYPQTGGKFPSIRLVPGQDKNVMKQNMDDDETPFMLTHPNLQRVNGDFLGPGDALSGPLGRSFASEVRARYQTRQANNPRVGGERREEKIRKRNIWKRDAQDRNGSIIDPWYGCYLWNEMVDYAVNYTYPWNTTKTYDPFDVIDAIANQPYNDPSVFLNIRNALHAPAQEWFLYINYPWGSTINRSDPTPAPMVFFDELAANMTEHGVHMVIYVGNDDGLSPHFGTEVTIQNTTFGGIQGFTRKPSTSWYDSSGTWAGIVHQERNWTYALFNGAGHEVPTYKPRAAYTFLDQFILGTNKTGLVTNTTNVTTTTSTSLAVTTYTTTVTSTSTHAATSSHATGQSTPFIQTQELVATSTVTSTSTVITTYTSTATSPEVTVIGGENPTLQQSAIPGQADIVYGTVSSQGETAWPAPTVEAFYSHVGLVNVTGTGPVPVATSSGASSAASASSSTTDMAAVRTYTTTFTSSVVSTIVSSRAPGRSTTVTTTKPEVVTSTVTTTSAATSTAKAAVEAAPVSPADSEGKLVGILKGREISGATRTRAGHGTLPVDVPTYYAALALLAVLLLLL